MALYPPLVNSSLPAFPADSQNIEFHYFVPQTMSISDAKISKIQYTVVNQSNNVSVLKPTSIATVQTSEIIEIDNTNERYFYIPISNINGGWIPGNIYKVQIRFSNIYENSEWSSVCYLKATAKSQNITVEIINAEEAFAVYVESPQFYGRYENTDATEIQTKYAFTLIDYTTNEILEETGWQIHTDSLDSVVFSRELEDFKRYYLQYSIETKNGYTQTIKNDFLCTLDLLPIPEIEFKECTNDYEEGRIKVVVGNKDSNIDRISTNLILRRTDSKSNFTIWEDYKIFNIWDDKVYIEFYDYLIEHGVIYKYSIQTLSSQGYRGKSIWSPTVEALYEHIFLVGNNKQLKIKFNPKVSSWKRTLQEAKVETIGSQYPFITRNGNINYFTFPLEGLVSYWLDEQELFCSKNSLCGNREIATVNANHLNLTDDNIILEREFRNQVEEFLTNGDYKYFKSPTEGVRLVALTEVSLTPEDTLGRMIHSFRSTAYEIGDNSLTNLIEFGIQDKGEFISSEDMGEKEESFTLGTYHTVGIDTDLYNLIKQQVKDNEQVAGTNYRRKLKYIKNLVIEEISGKACSLEIQQNKNSTWDKITLSEELSFYHFPEMVKIYGLKCKTSNVILNLTYDAVFEYEEISSSIPDTNLNLTVVSKFVQLNTKFSKDLGNMNLFTAIKNNDASLIEVYNFSFLRVEGVAGTKFKVNGEEYVLTSDFLSREFKDFSISSAEMLTEGPAIISVVYNGGKQ